MTIRRGQEWGQPGALPSNGVPVRSDADARAVVETARRAGRPLPPLGLLGGDLCRTLGGPGDERRLHSAEAMTFTLDLGAVLADGRLHWFVAHLVARDPLWRRAFVAMNAQWLTTQWLGPLNLGPRAHPGDGRLDVYDVRLPLGGFLSVRSRARAGAHLPHPGIRERRTAAVQIDLGRPLPLRLDGVSLGRARNLSVRLEPDALTVVV